jgi:WD40 repeat protein
MKEEVPRQKPQKNSETYAPQGEVDASALSNSCGARAERSLAGVKEKLEIFNNKSRDVDVIRYVMGSERLLTVSNLADSENGSTLRLWNMGAYSANPYDQAPELVWESHFEDGIFPIVPSPDGRFIAVGTRGLLGLYAIERPGAISPFDAVGCFVVPNEKNIRSAAFSPDGRKIDLETADDFVRTLALYTDGLPLKEVSCEHRKPKDRPKPEKADSDSNRAA